MSTPRLLQALPAVYAAAAVRLLQPLLLLPLMAQRLGQEDFGRLSFVLVWSSLLAALAEGGFQAAATRLVVMAEPAERQRIAQQVFSARVMWALPVLMLAGLAVAAWGGPHAGMGDALAIAGLAVLLGGPATWYLQATHQLAPWARVEVGVYAVLIAAAVAWAHDLATYLFMQLTAAGVLWTAGWRWVGGGQSLWRYESVRPGVQLGARMLPVALAGAAYSVALPAAASLQMGAVALGTYVLADRMLRAVINGAEPVFALVYPRIVARQREAGGLRASLGYALRWALAGGLAGIVALLALSLVWQHLQPWLQQRAPQVDLAALQATWAVLGWLLPLLLGWKFVGYWMLGSGHYDTAYRLCVILGGLVAVAGAALWPGAATPAGLARLALGTELLVIGIAIAGMMATRPPAARDNERT